MIEKCVVWPGRRRRSRRRRNGRGRTAAGRPAALPGSVRRAGSARSRAARYPSESSPRVGTSTTSSSPIHRSRSANARRSASSAVCSDANEPAAEVAPRGFARATFCVQAERLEQDEPAVRRRRRREHRGAVVGRATAAARPSTRSAREVGERHPALAAGDRLRRRQPRLRVDDRLRDLAAVEDVDALRRRSAGTSWRGRAGRACRPSWSGRAVRPAEELDRLRLEVERARLGAAGRRGKCRPGRRPRRAAIGSLEHVGERHRPPALQHLVDASAALPGRRPSSR